MEDHQFIRGKVPMTKEHVRTITLQKLDLKPNSQVLDVGAGTGSVSVECAILAKEGKVTAIETNPDGIKLIHENMKKHNCGNYEVIEGLAPSCLRDEYYDAIFIGGSKGTIETLIDYSYDHLRPEGVLVMNFITIENVSKALQAFKNSKFASYDGTLLQASPLKTIGGSHMFTSENGVYILWAKR